LRTWYAAGLGRRVLDSEREELDQVLCNLFGYHLMQAGVFVDENLLVASRIPHCFVLDQEADRLSPPLAAVGVRGSTGTMPIAGASVDVVLLHHTLEFAGDPHRVLREVDRVLIPEGHVVICGFNPWSLWLPWRWLLRWRKQPPWCGRALRRARLRDWLALLGFDIVYTSNYFFRPPLRHQGVMNRLGFLEKLGRRLWPALGAGFVLVGRKRVIGLTPIKPRWRPRRSLIGDVVGTQNRGTSSRAAR
jgi:SAM-dependent methyltransferase